MPRPRSCSTICRQNKKLVEELIPSQISVTGVQRVLQTLLANAFRSATCRPFWKASPKRSGTPRTRYHHRTCARPAGAPALSPSPVARRLSAAGRAVAGWEQAFAESIVGQGEDRQLAMAPSQLRNSSRGARPLRRSRRARMKCRSCSPVEFRPFVRSIIERFRPQTVVMSQSEIHASARLKTVSSI